MISVREGAPPADLIQYFVAKVKHIINNEEDPVEVMVCIRCFGHLASLIGRILGQEELKNHFLLLFEISQNRVLDDITDSYKNVDNEAVQPENFKKILYRQKQLNSHIKAFALIVREMSNLSENHAKHLLDLFMIGVKKHKLFFEGYKKYLYAALVQLVMSLSNQTHLFKFWMKKAVGEMFNVFVELPTENRELYDQDTSAIKSASDFIVRLVKQDLWVEEKKAEFLHLLMTGIIDFFAASDFGYDEFVDQGKKLYIPRNHEDQHLTLRLALIFEEVQRQAVLDSVLPEFFADLLGLVAKGIAQFPRTSSLLKLFKTLLSCAERLSSEVLEKAPEHQDLILGILDSQFNLLRELRGDILLDYLRCLLGIPSLLLKNSTKILEVFKRALLITLETAGPQSLFMIDHAVQALERILLKDKVELREGREKFLQEVLPYFAALLDLETSGKHEGLYTLTVKESQLEKEVVLKRCITFLGSLGADLHYIAKGRTKENELEQGESDALKISIPILSHRISLNLNHIIKRTSQLALESPNEEVQSAACELFHGSMIVLIGKCSQGSQSGEDFVEAVESSLPSIVKLANNASRFAGLFRELLFQMARWLSFNKEEENPLVSSFVGTVLGLAGQGDKPEVRSLCLQSLESFLHSSCKYHSKFENQIKNFAIFFRKVEALTLHPDSFRRLAGLMSLKLVINQVTQSDELLKNLFFEICFYFFLFVRKQERIEDKSLSEDVKTYCEEIFGQIKQILRLHADKLTQIDSDSLKFNSINDLFLSLQKNLLTPEYLLRDFSLQLWLTIRADLPSHLSAASLKNSLSFLETQSLLQTPQDDPILAAKSLTARCSTLSCLLEHGVVQANHLRDCELFKEITPMVRRLCASNDVKDESMRRGVVPEVIRLAGNLKPEQREELLSCIRTPELAKNILRGAFDNPQGVDSCKRVLEVLGVDRMAIIREYVDSHEYRFDSNKDQLYSFQKRIPLKSLEQFFAVILKFLHPDEVCRELLNQVRVYYMGRFVKSARKNSSAEIVSRAKVLLRFLLDTRALKEAEIAEYLDPFNPSYDYFATTVQHHITKLPEQESRGLIRHLFQQSRKDHNLFASIVDLLIVFVAANRKTDAFFDSFNETFDPAFIRTHEIYLKNILNLGIIFLQEGKEISEEQTAALLEHSLSPSNRQALGLLALEFLGFFAAKANHEKSLIMYRRLRPCLLEYSRDILPVIYPDAGAKDKHTETITSFASRIFDLVKGSLMLEPFEVVFPLLRNKKKFKSEVSAIINAVVAVNRYDLLLRNVQFCMGIFRDQSISDSLEFNIRFSIVDRLLLPLLENAKEEHLREVFIEIYAVLSDALAPDLNPGLSARQQVLALAERGCAFRLLELFFRKISPLSIKETVHARIIGPSSEKNEVTKKVIVYCRNINRVKRKDFTDPIKYAIEKEGPGAAALAQTLIFGYYCSAYTCLVSVLMNTQTKEGPFDKFLLTSDASKNEFVLENLVDLTCAFNFPVSTNFVSENLKDYYKSDAVQDPTPRAGVRQFVARLTANSLFTQTLSRGRLNPEGLEDPQSQRQQLINLLNSQDHSDPGRDMDIEREKGEEKLEMDIVNQHPIMKSWLRLIDHLEEHFPKNEASPDQMPVWMGLLHKMFADHSSLPCRVVLLGILFNRAKVFKPFKKNFNGFLLEYLGAKETGGAGLHYFLRDACATLLMWNGDAEDLEIEGGLALLKRLCFEAARNLMKKLADESKPTLLLNIDVFQKLCVLMKKALLLDSGLLLNLLVFEEKKPQAEALPGEAAKKSAASDLTNTAVLWRISGISVLETAIYEGIELGSMDQAKAVVPGDSSASLAGSLSQPAVVSQHSTPFSQDAGLISSSVSMDIEAAGSYIVLHDKLLKAVLANMRTKKKVLCSAAFRLAGLYLNHLGGRLPFSHQQYEAVKEQVLREIKAMVAQDSKTLDANICEMCKVYPEFAQEEQILIQLTSYIIKTSGKQRGYIFNSLRPIYARCLEKPEKLEQVATELTLTLQANLDKILRDSDPLNFREFLLLVTEAAKLKTGAVRTFLKTCVVRVCEYSLKLLRAEDVGAFFEFIVLLHEYYTDSPEILASCKRYMIVGLASQDENLRRQFIDFLHSDERVSRSEQSMLTFILKDLYSVEFEHHWLTASALMVLSLALSKNSAQKDALIFDRPVEGYVSSGLLNFSKRVNMASQMSQPLIPLSLALPSTYLQTQADPKIDRVASGSLMGEDREKVLKAKVKYAGDPQSGEKPPGLNMEEPISVVYNRFELDSVHSKLSIRALNNNLASERNRTAKNVKYKQDIRDFVRQNQLSFNQISQTDQNKIRVIDQLGVKMKKPDPKSMSALKKEEPFDSHVRTLREYRQGELPDIQIKYSDLLKPLSVLSIQDARMAQLVFVPLFIEVHNKQPPIANQAIFRQLLSLIDQSQGNYQVINTVQTILYELSMKADLLDIDPSLIAKTGTGSLSFGGAALLLEDMLSKVQRSADRHALDKPTQRTRDGGYPRDYPDDEKFAIEIDDRQSVNLILNLIEVYKQMNEDDVLRGLYRLLHSAEPSANEVAPAHQCFDLKMGKKITLSLKRLEEMLRRLDGNEEKAHLLGYLNQEKRENLYHLNKWDDLVQDIKQDPCYASAFLPKDDDAFILTDIGKLRKNERYYLLRGMLNEDKYWESFRLSAEYLLTDPLQKTLIEKEHSYELSLLSIVMLEFDRAKFYLEKFREKFLKNWSSVKDFTSFETKTEVISELLRQQELKDFLYNTKHYNLSGLQNSPDLANFFEHLGNWVKKKSSSSLNNFNYLSDSYHSRCLFIDIMKNRYEEYRDEESNKHMIQVALEYTRGLLKMGLVDTADRILMASFKRKEECLGDDNSLDYDFASLMVKSKIGGLERDINFISRLMDEKNIDLRFLKSKFSKVNQVIDSVIDMNKDSSDFVLKTRFNLLKLKVKTKEISAIRDYLGPGQGNEEVEAEYFSIISEIMPMVALNIEQLDRKQDVVTQMDLQDASLADLKMKMLRKGCEVTENILRWYKSKADDLGVSLQSFAAKRPELQVLHHVQQLVKFAADLADYGQIAHSRTLFVLEMTGEFSAEAGAHFLECFRRVPCWIFLKWTPQIMSYLNFDSGSCFLPMIERMLQEYPEPLIYSLSVTTDYSTVFKKPNANIEKLARALLSNFTADNTHFKFIRAMECLLHPDQRLKSWLDCFEENAAHPARLALIKERLLEDLFLPIDKLVGDGLGDFNKKFAKDLERTVTKVFGANFANLEKMAPQDIQKAAQELFSKADAVCKAKSIAFTASSYKAKLSSFSGWLSEYDINNYRRHDLRIEIPGQYSGDSIPVPELHVKISYFLPEVLVIQSIRKPKRLTMLGTDEKVYHCLVKGGEDLRLDQRIEQLFSLMNELFVQDADCCKREFSIGTFNVIPVKKNLGVMEWVKNTIPLKTVIEREMDPREDILNNNAYIKRTGLLKQLAKNKDIRDQHLALVAAKRELVVADFNVQLKYFKSTHLKNAIKKKVQNAEQFVKLRKVFLSNYAVLSLGSYLLGVGDRHLDNFLFDYVNGKIIPIDFGYSFGFGVGLFIPELMPFRLTQNFLELNYPLSVQGIFRNSMIFALKALKDNKHLLIDTCEVFIRDPLIDWVKIARSKANNKSSQAMEEQASAYPRDKLRIVKMKLTGYNPVTVLARELDMSRHAGQPYFPQLLETTRGAPHRPRAAMDPGIIPLCEQVDALIDMATDPDILGRAWTGWAPYA